MAKFQVSALENAGEGIEITGLTLDQIANHGVRDELNRLWLEHGVIVFREMDGGAVHVALSKVFGPCQVHPIRQSNTDPDHMEITNVQYTPGGPNGMVYNVNGVEVGARLPFHTDLIYFDLLNHGGLLRPVVIPKARGATRFLDKITLYDTLSDDLKAKIEGLEVVYKFDVNIERMKFRVDDVKMVRLGHKFLDIESRLDQYPRSIHPMVYTQAGTGRKILNLSPWFAEEIVGMDKAESDALLKTLTTHVLTSPAAYDHRWREGDIALWDNWRVLHGAEGVDPDDSRWMQRTTIAGDYALGRLESKAASELELVDV